MPPLCEIKVLSKNLPQTGCRPCARSKFCLRTCRKQDAALVRDQSSFCELAANRMPPLCEIKVLSKNLPQTGCRPCARSKFFLRTYLKQDAALVRDQSFAQQLAANRMPPLCEFKVLSNN